MKKIGTTALVVLAAVTLSSFTLGCKKENKPTNPPPTNQPSGGTGGTTGGTGGGH